MVEITRRDFLKTAAASAALAGCAGAAKADGDPNYAGFKMGLQTYSLRNFGLDKTLEILRDLKLGYGQFYHDRKGRQLVLTDDPARIAGFRSKLKAAGVKILSFGVQRYTKDHEANKANFEFARKMGFDVCVAGPTPDSFDSINELCKEYGMKIAIHNHGPQDKLYGKLDQLLRAVEKYPDHIGACVDTGHTIRIGEDPVKSIKALGPRVHDIHLKDAVGPTHQDYRIVGEGKLDVVATLQALKAIKFTGMLALEYELNPDNPVPDIRKCLASTRAACKDL